MVWRGYIGDYGYSSDYYGCRWYTLLHLMQKYRDSLHSLVYSIKTIIPPQSQTKASDNKSIGIIGYVY